MFRSCQKKFAIGDSGLTLDVTLRRPGPKSVLTGTTSLKRGTLDLKMIAGLLSEGILRAVRDPVDRIWAVAGLFEGSFRHQIMQHIDLRPKARQEYWSAYINFTKELLLWDSSLGILSIPPSPERDPRLATWCPDFSKWPTHVACIPFSTTSVRVSLDWEI